MPENLSAVLVAKDQVVLQEMPPPGEPGPNEVILATHSVGICGSDVSYWKRGQVCSWILKEPMILGHETSATVAKVGPGVTNVKVGDRVAVEPGIPCRTCTNCKLGKYNLCPSLTFHATPPHHGTLTKTFLHAADFCFKLPDNVSYEEGAFLEPLSVAVHACNRAQVGFGHKVLILGAGPIGLLSMLVARAYGAQEICITDINESRLEFAKKIGADHTMVIGSEKTAKENASRVNALMGCQPDIAIECCGQEASISLGIWAVKSGGVVTLVGMGPQEVSVPLQDATAREIDVRGSSRYRNCYPLSLSLIASGKVDVKPLITHRYNLEETLDALEMARSGKAIKVMIRCDPSN